MSDSTNPVSDGPGRRGSAGEDELAIGPEAGISPEDRRDVTERIEAVVRENRIRVTPELLAVGSGRSGALFPALVNVVAVVVLAGGLALGLIALRRSEADLAGAQGTFKTAEGRLIAELRRQTDELLQSKDGEIQSIQQRLAGVRQERDQILKEIDDRVRQKEEELRKALVAEMDTERKRMLAAGQSRDEVNARISDLQSRRSGEIAREVEDYRKQLQQEWERQLAGLRLVQSQYQDALTGLEQERLSISREAQAREQSMRREAAEQAKAREELAAQGEQARREAAEAQKALAALSDQTKQEALVSSQILGLYGRVADDVSARRYDGALEKLDSLRRIYADPRFVALPGVKERMKVDLFLADALGGLVREQQRLQQVDIASLTTAAGALAELRSRAAEAKALAAAGKPDEADLRYRDALAAVPAAAEAYAFLHQQELNEHGEMLAAFGKRRAEAEAALVRGDQAAALSLYAAALVAAAGETLPAQDGEAVVAAVRRAADRLAQTAAGSAGAETAARADRVAREQIAESRRQAEDLQRALAARDVEIRRLAPFEQREKSLREKYRGYQDEEKRLLQSQGEATGLAAAWLALNAFLTSEPASSLMPGFSDRTQRYQKAFEAAGRENAVEEIVDLVYELSGRRDRAARLAFLDSEKRRSTGNDAMLQLIGDLRALVSEQ